MKKKISVVIAVIALVSIGRVAYAAYEQHIAKHTFLEWIYEVEPETITDWGAVDTRNVQSTKDYIDLNLKDEQKKELCLALKSIKSDEVTLGRGRHDARLLSLYFFVLETMDWNFRFDGEVVWLYGIPEELQEVTGWWPWEIRNEKLNEFLSGLLEQ